MSAEPHPDAAAAAGASHRRRIWLCADDYGIAPGVDTAIRDLVVRGRINATSVMVAAPAFDRSEAISLGILNAGVKRVAIGLHVTLTAPFRPISSGFRPLQQGAFLPLDATLRVAFLRRFRRERLAIEIASQLQAFVAAFGRAPDFVDGHQHVHLFPQVRDELLRVVKEAAPNAWVRQCGRVTRLHDRLSDRKGLLLDLLSRQFRRRADELGLRTNPAFAGTYDFTSEAKFADLFPKFLDRLPDDAVVMCHPGHVDDELRRLDPLTDAREREYAYLAADDFPRVLAERGVALG